MNSLKLSTITCRNSCANQFVSKPTRAGPDGLLTKWTCVLARLSVRGMLDVGYLTSTVVPALTPKQTHPSSQGHTVVAILSPLFSRCKPDWVGLRGHLYHHVCIKINMTILACPFRFCWLRILYVFYRVGKYTFKKVSRLLVTWKGLPFITFSITLGTFLFYLRIVGWKLTNHLTDLFKVHRLITTLEYWVCWNFK